MGFSSSDGVFSITENGHFHDAIVVGAGLAGLGTALFLAEHGARVGLILKAPPEESASAHAQGGMAAAVGEEDCPQDHARDTLLAACGLASPEVVSLVAQEAAFAVFWLESQGVRFDRDSEGRYHLAQEGAHARRRVLHVADETGKALVRSLWKQVRKEPLIRLFPDHFALDLIRQDGRVRGIWALFQGKPRLFLADAVVLATGGAGRLWLHTSNPAGATGDGMAMASRAGAVLANLEFCQFHPTTLLHPKVQGLLLSEALRGEGALLVNAQGKRFMQALHPRAELAPRDVVARAIFCEIRAAGAVFLDLRPLGRPCLQNHFPATWARLLALGLDPLSDLVPVVPAAHYFCGGIAVDEEGKTSLPGLWAVGECAHTGLHGANRLASNSLLECVIFASRAASSMAKNKGSLLPLLPSPQPPILDDKRQDAFFSAVAQKVRTLAWENLGIVRSQGGMEEALLTLAKIASEMQGTLPASVLGQETRNLTHLAALVAQSAQGRRESLGAHFRRDFPAVSAHPRPSLLFPCST